MVYVDIKGSYFGGKSGAGVYQTIINEIPPHDGFISACLGYCGIMRHKRPAAMNIGFDPNEEVGEKWLQADKPEGYEWRFCRRDVLDWLENLDLASIPGSYYIYFDPPYLLESRKDARPRYRYEWGVVDHLRLIKLVQQLPCLVGISHYPNPLYDELLQDGDWRHIDFTAQTRGGPALERFYMNYPEPDELHDYSYLGGDYKERENIKLKFDRWKSNYNNLSPKERSMRRQWLNECQ